MQANIVHHFSAAVPSELLAILQLGCKGVACVKEAAKKTFCMKVLLRYCLYLSEKGYSIKKVRSKVVDSSKGSSWDCITLCM